MLNTQLGEAVYKKYLDLDLFYLDLQINFQVIQNVEYTDPLLD